MKRLIISICFFYCIISVAAQDANNFREIDKIALNIPESQTNTTDDIAAYVNQHFDKDVKKIRAIYTWVTNNIKYDMDSIHRVILDEDREEKVTFALKRKKGICENFAAIFNNICTKSGINSFVIEGYTMQNGSIDKSPHVWCGAFINNKWFLYDPTWDAGFMNNGQFINTTSTKYFQLSPEDFIQTHFPYDPMFQFLNYPVTYKEFSRGYFKINSDKTYFNYIDSISAYEKMDPLKQYLSAFSRIENNGAPVSMSDIKLKKIKMEAEIIYQDADMDLYNGAVADYNNAIINFNDFINYRNNQFLPTKKEDEVQEMFNKITNNIATANIKLNEINQSKARLTLDTGDIQKKLNDLAIHVKEQQDFFKNYLSTARSK